MEKMKGKAAIEERRERLAYARKMLTARSKIEYRKAVALLSFNLGVTDRKAREYIETLVMVDGIELKNGMVVRK